MFLATSVLPSSISEQVDRPAGERDLLAGRLEDLVGRHDDPAVRLEADLEPVALVGVERRWDTARRARTEMARPAGIETRMCGVGWCRDGVRVSVRGRGRMAGRPFASPRPSGMIGPPSKLSPFRTHPMHRIALVFTLLVVGLAAGQAKKKAPPKEAPVVPPREGKSETIKLFNGKTLDGWEGYEDLWSVKDGVIVAKNTEPLKFSTYLLTKEKFTDFRLMFAAKLVESEMHSGVASGARSSRTCQQGPGEGPDEVHLRRATW